MSLYSKGQRLYINSTERANFLKAAKKAPREIRTFCSALHHSGYCFEFWLFENCFGFRASNLFYQLANGFRCLMLDYGFSAFSTPIDAGFLSNTQSLSLNIFVGLNIRTLILRFVHPVNPVRTGE